MPEPTITTQLTKFEQIEVLRLELGELEEELRLTEVKIRDVLYEIERLKYLRGLHALYQKRPEPKEAANLPQLQAQRDTLRSALEALQAALSTLEKETAGQIPPPGRGAGQARPGAHPAAATPAGKRKFESFDDFRANR